MKYKFLVSAVLFGLSIQANAYICTNEKGEGVVDEVFFDLTDSFTSSNNAPGKVVELKKNFDYTVKAVCPKHSSGETNNYTQRSYTTTLPIIEETDRYKYLEINEYLIGAMKITDSAAGDFYPPQNYVQMGKHPNVSKGQPFPVKDSNFTFRLKVIKPFIDFVVIPKKTMFQVYVTTGSSDPLTMPVYRISYSGMINVPQSCDIGPENTLEIDFGKIAANAFKQAGAGNKPTGVNEQTKTLFIQCKNIDVQAALTVRLQAERITGDIIQSDNPDIGFKMSDINGKVLIPNDINSVIPFRLDDQPVQVPIKAWPVSLTGKEPATGPFRSRGYIRVDFE